MAAYVPTPMSSVEIEPNDGEEQPWTAMTPGGGSGLVVLSSTLLPLYVNPEAFELLRLLNLKDSFLDDGSCAWGRLPEVLRQLGAEMVGFLKMRIEAADWRPVDLKRLAGDLLRPIQLHGVGVPDRRGIARVRIIVTVEEVIPSQRTPQRAECREITP